MALTTSEKVSNHIPDDVSFSILSKLPLKSLKRFTCVRKSWTTLFENPYFMSMFRNNLISKHNSFYDDDMCLLLKNELQFPGYHFALYILSGDRFENKVKLALPPPFQENCSSIHILGKTMNGTLCLYDGSHTAVLWNPAKMEYKVLPPIPPNSPPYIFTEVTLHGFGYDHVSDDYKVIRHVACCHTDLKVSSLWQIYSLKSNCWRKLDVNMPIRCSRSECAVVYLNGVCHWWGKTNVQTYVVSFNLSNEAFITTPFPLDMHDCFPYEWVEKHVCLMLLNGSIAMISKHAKTTAFHISILDELGVKESWTKLFIVGPLLCVGHPIGVGKKGDIFFSKTGGKVVRVDLSTQTIEEYGVKGDFYPSRIVIYKKNFLPIGGIND